MNEIMWDGFVDELNKLAKMDTEDKKTLSNLYAALAGVGGVPVGGALGAFAGGKGRRGRGALLGALLGAGIGAAKGKYDASRGLENLQRGAKMSKFSSLQKYAKEKPSVHGFSKSLDSPQRSAAEGATALGTLGALAGLLAGKKGARLKRLLVGGTLGAGVGGLGHLYGQSKKKAKWIDIERELSKS